ncbi:NRDE family protein [Vibrio sp. M260118]|uniref:NRDE family protein n=1 Tax=Vibrio sp. M260118 TaxID=3020896 RepID=UPI002F3E2688
MCTLSWLYHGNNHYEVYFNRDEQRSRLPALEPQSVVIDGVHCLMPIDPVGGGSWISTNEHGVTVCLLNYYQGTTPKGELSSRGNIVKRLASSCSSSTVDSRLLGMDLSAFAPFTVVSFDTRRTSNETVMWTWDGQQLHRSHAFAPIVSSVIVSCSKQEMHYQSIDNHRNVDFRTSLSCMANDVAEQGVFK